MDSLNIRMSVTMKQPPENQPGIPIALSTKIYQEKRCAIRIIEYKFILK